MENKKDYETLVGAVERYVQSTSYPDIKIISAILGIEIKKEGESHG